MQNDDVMVVADVTWREGGDSRETDGASVKAVAVDMMVMVGVVSKRFVTIWDRLLIRMYM